MSACGVVNFIAIPAHLAGNMIGFLTYLLIVAARIGVCPFRVSACIRFRCEPHAQETNPQALSTHSPALQVLVVLCAVIAVDYASQDAR